MHKNTPFYVTLIGLFVLLKFAYRLATNNELIFLLKPTNWLIQVATNSHAIYAPEQGYYNPTLNIIIDKSCSGFNFWLLSFLLFAYLAIKYLHKPLSKIRAFPIALMGAYVLTLWVNSSRILASILLQPQTERFFLNQQAIVHEVIGITLHLTFLILAYLLVEKQFTLRTKTA